MNSFHMQQCSKQQTHAFKSASFVTDDSCQRSMPGRGIILLDMFMRCLTGLKAKVTGSLAGGIVLTCELNLTV